MAFTPKRRYSRLSESQQHFLASYLATGSLKKARAAVSCTPRMVQMWIEDSEVFEAEYSEIRETLEESRSERGGSEAERLEDGFRLMGMCGDQD